MYKQLWFSLNRAFPRKLWTSTVDVLVNGVNDGHVARKKITQEDLALDPLQVMNI